MNAPLSDDAQEAAAAALFKQLIDSSNYTHESFAAEVGVSPGRVSQWATNRGGIPPERAMKVAALLGTKPELISVSWRRLRDEFMGSQPARLDPEMLAESIEALRRVWARRGLVFDPIAQPEMVVYAYELLAEMGEEPTTAQLIDFGARLAERDKAKAGVGDERVEDKRSSGVDRARAKGRGSKPA